jgi:hypothetical protein
MVLLSLHGLSAAQIAVLLERHPATVRRWIDRFSQEGLAGWLTGPGVRVNLPVHRLVRLALDHLTCAEPPAGALPPCAALMQYPPEVRSAPPSWACWPFHM